MAFPPLRIPYVRMGKSSLAYVGSLATIAETRSGNMENEQFIQRMQQKIQRLTERRVNLEIDREEVNQLPVDLGPEIPGRLGANVLQYAGFARMCMEYAVESIRRDRTLDTLEFHLLLARN